MFHAFLVLLKAEVPKYFNDVSSYGTERPGVQQSTTQQEEDADIPKRLEPSLDEQSYDSPMTFMLVIFYTMP